MTRPETDYATYPGDRNTRQTPAQRAKKVESARVHARWALGELKAVCDDFSANGYRLTHAEREEWSNAAALHDGIRRALDDVR